MVKMRWFHRGWLLFLILLIPFLLAETTGETAPNFFPLADIKPGMKAECHTVFKGDKIESIPVEIVGVVEGSGPVRHFILIKFTGNSDKLGISAGMSGRSEEHTSELQSRPHLVCRLLLEKKKKKTNK